MALAFKRGQKELEEGGFKDAASRIEAAAGKAIPLEADYDSIKALAGESEWYSGKKEGNNSIALRYLNEQGKWICITVESICKDDLGKEAFTANVEKIVFKVTDKGPKNCDMRDIKFFNCKIESKVLEITCNLDFTQYVGQSFPYSDMTKVIEKMLESGTSLAFNRMKLELEEGKLKEMQSRLASSLGYEIPIEIDWEPIRALPGDAIWYSEKPEPKGVIGLRYVQEQGLWGIIYAFESVGKDDLGKEALQETFKKIVVHVTAEGPKNCDMREFKFHPCEKKGKEFHITHKLDFTQYVGQNFPYSDCAKAIEGMM